MPFCLYLSVSLRRVLWLKKGTVSPAFQCGKDVSGLLRSEGSPSEIRKTPEGTHTDRARSVPSPQGWNARGKISCAGGAAKLRARPAEGNLASLLSFLCYSGHLFSVLAATGQASKSPTSLPAPSTRQNPDGSWGQPGDTLRFIHHSPSVIAP